MSAEGTYQWLIGCSAGSLHEPFDIHIFASVFALALSEAEEGTCELHEAVGIEPLALSELVGSIFPRIKGSLESPCGSVLVVDEEEQSIRDILAMYASGACELERPLAAMIARRCNLPHHLWQDLGLRDRNELSRLMCRHFHPLAEKNRHNMKWKKFLYRMVCGAAGFTLCSAPVCSECDDFAGCFGAEDGEALLAGVRNSRDEAV